MITRKKAYFNTFIFELGKFTLEPYESFWDGVPIFKPEIKNITQ